MEVIKGYKNLKGPLKNPALTLGNFDGVHLGHQALLSRVREKARELGGTSMVYTFHPHPLSVFSPGKPLSSITTIEEKLTLIEECGIELVICEPFTVEFSSITAEAFVREILHERIGVREVFVGEDYAFGSKREGNIHYLRKMGGVLDFRVRVVESITIDDIIVKSSKIRVFIQQGEIGIANRLLGRSYRITGTVVTGKRRGVQLGFPTANIKPHKMLHPGVGVYAVWVKVKNERFKGAMNIGYNPTFKDQELSLEVHILDFARDLYGEDLTVDFVERIREEKRFSSVDELVTQMRQDVIQVRNILKLTA